MNQIEHISRRCLLLYPDGKTITEDSQELWAAHLGQNQNSGLKSGYLTAVKQLKLAAKGPGSDKGHFMFFPKGALIFNLLSDWVEGMATDIFEAFAVRTPLIYRWDDEGVQGQMKVFSPEMYKVETPGEEPPLILRPNADIGLFQMVKGEKIPSATLPIRFYENAYCLRLGQSGSLSGLKRARSFSLVDVHSLCSSMEQGLAEYLDILSKQIRIIQKLGLTVFYQFKTTEEFYAGHADYIFSLVKLIDKPVLLEVHSGQRQYWVLKNFMLVDGECRLFHIQLDFDNTGHYDLSHWGEGDEKGKFVIIHNSLATIERWLIIFLSEALKRSPPSLPLWLAPTQIRLLPINEKHREFCFALSEKIQQSNIRVDIDDRSETLGFKIRRAEEEWISYTIVCGDQETNLVDSSFTIRCRGGRQQRMKITELTQTITDQTKNLPFRKFPGLWLSRRPAFV